MIYAYLCGIIITTVMAFYVASRQSNYDMYRDEYIIDAMFKGVLWPFFAWEVMLDFWRITR